tara:strand:+ start:16454 stop:17182 length:729 start_codon:yes stop_codon:yes gene_type:complete
MGKLVKVVSTGEITEVILNRPEKLNALSTLLLSELKDTITSVSKKSNLRCVIISGSGRSFSSGADITELKNFTNKTAKQFIELLHMTLQSVRNCPVPVIAKVSGPCIGGGLELAISCDIRAASENSTFAMPEVLVGMPSVIEAALLPRLIGWGRTSEILYTGCTLTAQEAKSIGLIEKIAPLNEIDHLTNRWTEAIISANPKAVRSQKSLMRRWENLMIDEAIEVGLEYFSKAYSQTNTENS